ncbi:MAG TPA: 6-hydroxymethylpterin diphosphokinase MptE-like protein [Candidatus Thermoplasmatota archaeon]|nr:6-hydroxymethylpterin diphosphokinase MptE-like protein [Candidatus Thermoplasmatota archaeon]
MHWRAWEPTYRAILADFGYDALADEEARDLLALLSAGRPRPDLAALRAQLAGREVCIVGPRAPAKLPDAPIVATDAAMGFLRESPLCIVTDLDGDADAQLAANARGVPLFLHAHGDNRDALRRYAPQTRGPVQPTTQAHPVGPVANYGGFTDGDRACCLAAHLGARSLLLAGFDFETPVAKVGSDPTTKKRKLRWARHIVASLGIPYRHL